MNASLYYYKGYSLREENPRLADWFALRYLLSRISVPRDMSIYAAKRLREALETTAALVGNGQGTPISVNHRRDQDPANFGKK